jgi:hypothetical protein
MKGSHGTARSRPPTAARCSSTLELGEVLPLGAAKARRVDVALLSATAVELEECVANKTFRRSRSGGMRTAGAFCRAWPGNVRERLAETRLAVLRRCHRPPQDRPAGDRARKPRRRKKNAAAGSGGTSLAATFDNP